MTPNEEKQITQWNSRLSHEIRIHLIVTEDDRSNAFSQFGKELSRLAPKVHISKEKDESEGIPAIRIHTSLRYQAIRYIFCCRILQLALFAYANSGGKFAVRVYSSRIPSRISRFSAVANFSDVFDDLVIFIFRFLRQSGTELRTFSGNTPEYKVTLYSSR